MSRVRRVVDAAMDHTRIVIVVMLVATVAIGAGASMVDQSSSLDQFQSDSPEAEALEYLESNFTTGSENTTTAQVIVRDDDVLDGETLVALIDYQQALRTDETVNRTLAGEPSSRSIANVLATASLRQERGAAVQATATELERLNQSVTEERRAIEERNATLSATSESLQAGLTTLRENPDQPIGPTFESVQAETPVELNETDRETFRTAAQQLRAAPNESAVEAAYELGTRGVLADEYGALERRSEALTEDVERLESLAADLERQRARLANASEASLDEQREAIESLNESELETLIGQVLGENGNGGSGVLSFMPTNFDRGATSAEATVLFVTQESTTESAQQGAASEAVVDAQLRMQSLGEETDEEVIVFGAGVISDEIDSSLGDSLAIVGPLALVFVFVALTVAYRDALDIALGLVGIFVVLVWTFGFMGWADVAFNQILISVPVLLIGLSIDYAIHVFMRHREQRTDDDTGPRGSMRTALTGVGVALLYVTATTVIGFMSNLTSPVGPIQDFGVVSSFGILAALLVFTLLIPALKVEADELLEGWGLDRNKRAFGTGGGAFSSVLSVGAVGARRLPAVVILVALLVSAGGVFGATQVDTSFEQEDFIADDPPDVLKDLPEPFAPGDYTAKQNLEYVNENFVREDSQAQILVRGDLTRAETLQRLDSGERVATDQSVTQTVGSGEADITSPLSVMRSVAAENETFNATFTAADTDGDGVPDRDLRAVYDELYAVAPDEAEGVLYRDDGEYVAARLVVPIVGGANGDDVTEQMRVVASEVDGDGYAATATGSAVLNKIVQDDLLSTVIDSLIVTLVATFLFLMVTYRVTEGSATLGVVTLLPVVLSVTWILGTMFLLGIPFNVLTGTITSLTIGLGVAYSIHLSERYNLELERTGEVWTAMDRAVTGTGGALLGSAATTVGGFGTLALAILPPLQQFGIITGLTIVYAFLASVLVLPSLLIVWTRFTGVASVPDSGPDTGGNDGNGDDGTGPTGASGNSGGSTAAGDSGGSTAAGTSGGSTAAGDSETPTAERHVDRSSAAPGERVAVEVVVRGVEGRAVLRETAPAVAGVTATPTPVDAAVGERTLYVAWDGQEPADATAADADSVGSGGRENGVDPMTVTTDEDETDGVWRLTYHVAVPEEAADGADLGFDGDLRTAAGGVEVGGAAGIAVADDPVERALKSGVVTGRDLSEAHEGYEAGRLTDEELARVHEVWLRTDRDTSAAPELESASDD